MKGNYLKNHICFEIYKFYSPIVALCIEIKKLTIIYQIKAFDVQDGQRGIYVGEIGFGRSWHRVPQRFIQRHQISQLTRGGLWPKSTSAKESKRKSNRTEQLQTNLKQLWGNIYLISTLLISAFFIRPCSAHAQHNKHISRSITIYATWP